MELTTTLSRLSGARIKTDIISKISSKLQVNYNDQIPYSGILFSVGIVTALDIARVVDRQFDRHWRNYVLGLLSKIEHLIRYPCVFEAISMLAAYNEGMVEASEVARMNKKVWDIKTQPCHIDGWQFEEDLDSSFCAWNALEVAISTEIFTSLDLLRYHFREALTMEWAENAVRGIKRTDENEHVWDDAVKFGEKKAYDAECNSFLDAIGYIPLKP